MPPDHAWANQPSRPSLSGAGSLPDPSNSDALLLTIIALLLLGVGAAVLSRLARLSRIVGFLLLGTGLAFADPQLLGKSGAATLLAELGVSFLLFDIGLHFSLAQLREQAADIFGFGPLQILFGTVALGIVGVVLGLPLAGAALIGMTLSLSSTAVVGNIVAERHQRNCPVGLTGTAILIFQDLAAVVLLIVATALHQGGALPALGSALLKALLAFGAAVLIARTAVRPLFALLARSGSDEIFTAAALAIALVAGWAAQRIGLSMTLGAFLGGMMLAESPFRAVIRAEIAPFRGLLLAFFFISVGGSLSPAALAAHWPAVIALAVGLMAVKCLTNASASLVFRWSLPGSVQLGFLLAQGSEFAFVILGVPSVRGMIGVDAASELTAAVALTLALTPPVSAAGRRIAGRLRRAHVPYAELKARGDTRPVLILGMGETGRTVADALNEFGIGYDAVESDGDALRRSLADGYAVFFGDFSDPRLWRAVDLSQRRFSVVTEASRALLDEVGPVASAFYSAARHVLVCSDRSTATDLSRSEFEVVLEDERPLGRKAARHVLAGMNIDASEIEGWSTRQRERDSLRSMAT